MLHKNIINQNGARRRIDQIVLDLIPNLTRSSAKSLLMEGIILVNNLQVRPNYKTKENDSISFDEESLKKFLDRASHYSIKPVKMNIEVIYEDEDTLVVNKPAGLTTHPVPGHREDTLLNGLVYYQQHSSPPRIGGVPEGGGGKIRPVHRLDKDTSGVILFAKSRDAHVFYSEQFERNKVEKTYLAIVKGDFKQALKGKDHITVQNYLARSNREKKKMVAVSPQQGQIAISNIYFERYWQGLKGIYSIVKIIPKTGRTHQIRVHLAGLGFPIVGDPFYSNTSYRRLMLHAYSLKIRKCKDNEETFITELPEEFK